MTVTLHLPADLEGAIRAHATAGGFPLSDTIVALLRDTVTPAEWTPRRRSTIPRLEPGHYPDDGPFDEITYQAVPFPVVGTVPVRFVPAGPLTPAVVADAD